MKISICLRGPICAALIGLALCAGLMVGPVIGQEVGRAVSPEVKQAAQAAQTGFEVPVELYANKLLLQITLKGHTYTALYDSGAESSAISAAAAQELGLQGVDGGTAQGFGGVVGFAAARRVKIELGAGTQSFDSLPIFDFTAMVASFGRRFDFILGSDAMRGHVVEIDPRGPRMRWTPRGLFNAPQEATLLRLGRQNGVFTLPMRVNGVAGTAGIDIGAASPLAASRGFAERAGFSAGSGASRQGSGIAGTYESRITSAASALLVGTPLPDVPILLESGELPSGADINLGLPFLLRFHIFLDYQGRRIWLAPLPGNELVPFERNLVGLRVARVDRDKLKLLHVSDLGPAQAAGLRSGDVIVAIDAVRVADWPPGRPMDAWMYGPAGAIKTLTLADGREVKLKLGRYY